MSRIFRFPLCRGPFIQLVGCGGPKKSFRFPPWEHGFWCIRGVASILSGLMGSVIWLVSRIMAFSLVFRTPKEGRGWLYKDSEEEVEY